MKTQTKKSMKSREGGALLMVMLVLLIFSTLQIGLYKTRESTGVESVYVEQGKQAFWLAEAGLNDGTFLIDYSSSFRTTPVAIPTITNSVINGTYDISIAKSAINAALGTFQYTITSVGAVNGFNRRLQKIVTSTPGGKYAIIGISGNTDLAANVKIDGPIAQIDGDMTIKDSRGLTDDSYVIMGNGDLTDPKGEAIQPNYPPPPAPSIDASKYSAELAIVNAMTNTPGDKTITTSVAAGQTLYLNENKVTFDGKLSIGDNAKIVVSGDLRFDGSGIKIGKNVTIVGGNEISFKVQATVASGSEVYAYNNILFESGSGLYTYDDPIILMAQNGDIEMNSNFDFRGIMIAENGQVDLNANGDIVGTVIGGVGVDASANINITYDATVFTEGTPVIPKSFGDVILTSVSWQELPPL